MIEISGVLTNGLGEASANLSKQLPLIAKEFSSISGCHHGSINVLLDKALVVATPDYRTSPIFWQHPHCGEVFDFLEIEISLARAEAGEPSWHKAWLYIPHWSPHRANQHMHEVIAPFLDGVERGQKCNIQIKRTTSLLPYDKGHVIVVGAPEPVTAAPPQPTKKPEFRGF